MTLFMNTLALINFDLIKRTTAQNQNQSQDQSQDQDPATVTWQAQDRVSLQPASTYQLYLAAASTPASCWLIF